MSAAEHIGGAVVDPLTIPVRFSRLKLMCRSAAHYLHAVTHERPDTGAYKLGRAVHRTVLQGYEPTVYDGRRAGKEWEAFAASHEVAEDILNVREAEQAHAVSQAVLNTPHAMELLALGDIERTLHWALDGRHCQGTPDVFTAGRVVDLKTCRDAHPERLMRDALRYAYHAQLAWYLDGVRLSGAGTPSEAYIVAVESTPPHPVTVLRLTPHTLDLGARQCRLWLEHLRSCEQSGQWPGYCQSVVDFDAPDAEGLSLVIDGEETEIT